MRHTKPRSCDGPLEHMARSSRISRSSTPGINENPGYTRISRSLEKYCRLLIFRCAVLYTGRDVHNYVDIRDWKFSVSAAA
jgi:hypothetical protein